MAGIAPTCDITLDDTLRHAVDGMFVINRDRHVVLFSAGCERLTGMAQSAVLGTSCPCHTLVDCEDERGRSLSGALCPAMKVFDGTVPHLRQRMTTQPRDGERVLVETTYSPVKDAQGKIQGVVAIMRDITDRVADTGGSGEASHGGAIDSSEVSDAFGATRNPGVGQAGDRSSEQVGSLDQILSSIEKHEILSALARSDGQRTLAARTLGISRSRLYRRMEALGIDPKEVAAREQD